MQCLKSGTALSQGTCNTQLPYQNWLSDATLKTLKISNTFSIFQNLSNPLKTFKNHKWINLIWLVIPTLNAAYTEYVPVRYINYLLVCAQAPFAIYCKWRTRNKSRIIKISARNFVDFSIRFPKYLLVLKSQLKIINKICKIFVSLLESKSKILLDRHWI